MENRIKNPFIIGGIVEGKNFIGRGSMLEELKESAIKGERTHVVGLPRMGKSSLLKRCFMEKSAFDEWKDAHHLIPIFLDGLASPGQTWYTIASKIGDALTDSSIQDAKGIIDKCEQLYGVKDSGDRFVELKQIIERTEKAVGFKFVIIIDEFDGAIDYKYTKDDFLKLKELGNYATIFTCSRRRATYIENTRSDDPVGFCEGKELFVGVFSEDDVKDYWETYGSYFSELNDCQMKEYRSLVEKYAGRQPQLMNCMNSCVLQKEKLVPWRDGTSDKREEIECLFRGYVKDMFDRLMKNVKEQKLDSAAINLVAGFGKNIPDDEKQLLIAYTFIRVVSSEEKKEMFGFHLGPTDKEKRRFVCFSEFTSHLIHEEYAVPSDGSIGKLLETTETKLREAVRAVIEAQWKDKPFSVVNNDSGTAEGYKEKWEKPYLQKVGTESVQKRLREMKETRKKREDNSTVPVGSRRVDLISSTTLDNLWCVFIQPQWKDFYSWIFDKTNRENLSNVKEIEKRREDWYKKSFDKFKKLRNADAHRNLKDHAADFIEEAKQECEKICRDIEDWNQTNKGGKKQRNG